MAFNDRLKSLRNEKGITQDELSKLTGIKKSSIGMYESGQRVPKYKPLRILADFFHVSTDYLIGHSPSTEELRAYMDEQLLGDSQNRQQIKAAKLYPLRETNRVPIIGSVRCGPGGLAYEYIDEYIAVDDRYRPDEILAFRAEGDSMEGDGIRDGDICIVHLQEDVPNGAIAVVVICNGEESEGTLKHVLKDEENGVVVLQSSNPKYPPRIFAGADANNVKIIGEVVEFRHTMRIKRIHVH